MTLHISPNVMFENGALTGAKRARTVPKVEERRRSRWAVFGWRVSCSAKEWRHLWVTSGFRGSGVGRRVRWRDSWVFGML